MSGITVHVTYRNRDLSWPPLLNSLSLHSRGGCIQHWLFRAGCAPESLSKRAANLSLGTAPRLLCLKSQHTLLVPLSTLYFSLINQQFLMIKNNKGKKLLPGTVNTLIHMCWAVALPALLQEEKGIMRKAFIWPSSLLHFCAAWVKLIKNITGSVVVVPWKFGIDKGAWSPKMDYSDVRYSQNVLKSYTTSQNAGKTRDSGNTHTTPPSISDYVLYIYYLWREPIFASPGSFLLQKSHNYMKHIPTQESTGPIMMHRELSGDPKTTPKHCGQTGNWTITPIVQLCRPVRNRSELKVSSHLKLIVFI